MTDHLGRLGKIFRAIDRALGGTQPPDRPQRFAARHPLVVGLLAGLASFLFGLVVSDHDSGVSLFPISLFGIVMGSIFAATGYAERKRQARLERAQP